MGIKTEVQLRVPSGDVIGELVKQTMQFYAGKRVTDELLEQVENDIFYAIQNCMTCSVSVTLDPAAVDNITDIEMVSLQLGD